MLACSSAVLAHTFCTLPQIRKFPLNSKLIPFWYQRSRLLWRCFWVRYSWRLWEITTMKLFFNGIMIEFVPCDNLIILSSGLPLICASLAATALILLRLWVLVVPWSLFRCDCCCGLTAWAILRRLLSFALPKRSLFGRQEGFNLSDGSVQSLLTWGWRTLATSHLDMAWIVTVWQFGAFEAFPSLDRHGDCSIGLPSRWLSGQSDLGMWGS